MRNEQQNTEQSLQQFIGQGSQQPAALMLEDGTLFAGVSCGAEGEVAGTLVFNTTAIGYVEALSDPACAGQILVMTYPQIGNYGVALPDLQRDTLALRGLVVRDLCPTPSSYRSDMSLSELLVQQGVVAVSELDTRALTQHIRDKGTMRALISNRDFDPTSLLEKLKAAPRTEDENLVAEVSTPTRFVYPEPNEEIASFFEPLQAPESTHVPGASLAPEANLTPPAYHLAVYDLGAQRSTLQSLQRAGCKLTILPWDTPPTVVKELGVEGVFFSSGPGDPRCIKATIEAAQALMGEMPAFGMGLGHQVIALAAGAQIETLKVGHHGGNQPVMDLRSKQVEITTQNHKFASSFPSLGALIPEESGGVTQHPLGTGGAPSNDMRFWIDAGVAPVVSNERFGRIQLTHVNLNDGTVEGVAFLDLPILSVQYRPEEVPGSGIHYLYESFIQHMKQMTSQEDNSTAHENNTQAAE